MHEFLIELELILCVINIYTNIVDLRQIISILRNLQSKSLSPDWNFKYAYIS